MSAGGFVSARYAANNGDVHPIRVQPETLSLNIGAANSSATGEITNRIRAKISKGNREIGIRPRGVVVRFTATVPDGYKADQTYRVPILTRSVFDGIEEDDTGTYLGSAVRVVSKYEEDVN